MSYAFLVVRGVTEQWCSLHRQKARQVLPFKLDLGYPQNDSSMLCPYCYIEFLGGILAEMEDKESKQNE